MNVMYYYNEGEAYRVVSLTKKETLGDNSIEISEEIFEYLQNILSEYIVRFNSLSDISIASFILESLNVLEKDMDNFHRNFFNKLSDSELNTWVILSKALKDSSVQKEMEKGKESGYKYLKSKYGLLETDVDNAMNKYGESLSQSFASDNNSNFSNFESDLDLDI